MEGFKRRRRRRKGEKRDIKQNQEAVARLKGLVVLLFFLSGVLFTGVFPSSSSDARLLSRYDDGGPFFSLSAVCAAARSPVSTKSLRYYAIVT